MSDPVDPIRRIDRTARIGRRGAAVRMAADAPPANTLPVPVGAAYTPAPEPATGADAAFAAQLLAGAPRRGLKGGAETLEQARSAYLETEYSGEKDRRAKAGQSTKTDI